MKAELTANGTLIVQAENGLESFALNAWSNDYFSHTQTVSFNDEVKVTSFPKTGLLIGLYEEKT